MDYKVRFYPGIHLTRSKEGWSLKTLIGEFYSYKPQSVCHYHELKINLLLLSYFRTLCVLDASGKIISSSEKDIGFFKALLVKKKVTYEAIPDSPLRSGYVNFDNNGSIGTAYIQTKEYIESTKETRLPFFPGKTRLVTTVLFTKRLDIARYEFSYLLDGIDHHMDVIRSQVKEKMESNSDTLTINKG